MGWNTDISLISKSFVFTVTEKDFKEFLLEKLEDIDFVKVRKDVERFLVDKEELKLLDGQLIKQL